METVVLGRPVNEKNGSSFPIVPMTRGIAPWSESAIAKSAGTASERAPSARHAATSHATAIVVVRDDADPPRTSATSVEVRASPGIH